MPGFNIGGAEGPSNVNEFRRKHRFRITTLGAAWDRQGLLLLKTASRPKFTLEEPVVHHDQEQAYFAGKQSWDPINISWYDSENNVDESANVYKWLNTVVAIDRATTSVPADYKIDCQLEMSTAAGGPSETWILYGTWPKEVNWGDLDYENTEIALIECTIRFDRAKRV